MNLNVTIRRFGPRLSEVTEPVVLFGRRIPRGFITDGVTVPWYFRWAMIPYGVGLPAAIVHDYELKVLGIPRSRADRNFFYNLRSTPKSWAIQAYGCYAALRVYAAYQFIRGKK